MIYKYRRLIIFYFFTCSFLIGQKDWVYERPVDPFSFIGIGSATIGNKDPSVYTKEAKALAFDEIASQILVNVSSSIEIYMMQENERAFNRAVATTRAASFGEINGAEMLDDYNDGITYYVYYRLNEKVHRKNVDRAADNASDLYGKYLETEDTNPTTQLSMLIRCMEQLFLTYGTKVSYDDGTFSYNLNTEVRNNIEQILKNLRLYTDNDRINGVVGSRIEKPLIVEVNNYLPEVSSEIPVYGMPVTYSFKKGGGDFNKTRLKTTQLGKARTYINRITSRLPNQSIVANIDISNFKKDPTKKGYLDDLLENLTEHLEIQFNLTISQRKNDQVAILAVGKEGITNNQTELINREFEVAISKITQFEIKDRKYIDNALKKTGQDYSDLCYDTDCRLDIGNQLKVEKFIFVELSYEDNEYSCYISMSNILDRTTTEPVTNYLLVKDNANKFRELRDEIPNWVNKFWESLNPGTVTYLAADQQQISMYAMMDPDTAYVEGKNIGDLPIYERPMKQGKYEFEFRAAGHLPLRKTWFVSPENPINERITLQKKSAQGAFKKSLIFPGRGQFYTSEENFTSRRNAGYIWAGLAISTLAGTVTSWIGFSNAQSEYDNAYQTYSNQKLLDDVIIHREIAQQKNDLMLEKQNTAILFTAFLGSIWLGNAIDAYINFPDYDGRFAHNKIDLGLHVGQIVGQPVPGLKISLDL